MWQGHPGERENTTRPRAQDRVETECSAHREDDRRGRRVEPGAEVSREFRARPLLSLLVQENEKVARSQCREEPLRLLRADARRIRFRARLLLLDDDDVARGEA